MVTSPSSHVMVVNYHRKQKVKGIQILLLVNELLNPLERDFPPPPSAQPLKTWVWMGNWMAFGSCQAICQAAQ